MQIGSVPTVSRDPTASWARFPAWTSPTCAGETPAAEQLPLTVAAPATTRNLRRVNFACSACTIGRLDSFTFSGRGAAVQTIAPLTTGSGLDPRGRLVCRGAGKLPRRVAHAR